MVNATGWSNGREVTADGNPAAWLRHLALDGDPAKAEPKTLRYRILHTAARLARSGRRRRLRIAASWTWANEIATAWPRITALAQAP